MDDQMNDQFQELQMLLRQRKDMHMPSSQYFEDFLDEFHRRQRSELLKRPVWRIMLDRFESFFSVPLLSVYFPSKTTLAYATSVVAAVCLTTAVFVNYHTNPVASTLASSESKSASSEKTAVAYQSSPSSQSTDNNGLFTNHPIVHLEEASYMTTGAENSPQRQGRLSAASREGYNNQASSNSTQPTHPRYVLDSQPVRYETSPTSF